MGLAGSPDTVRANPLVDDLFSRHAEQCTTRRQDCACAVVFPSKGKECHPTPTPWPYRSRRARTVLPPDGWRVTVAARLRWLTMGQPKPSVPSRSGVCMRGAWELWSCTATSMLYGCATRSRVGAAAVAQGVGNEFGDD